MTWVKFPNYKSELDALRAALEVASTLSESELADDEFYGYSLVDAGVIQPRTPLAELRQKARKDQGPIITGRGLHETFVLLGLMERTAGGMCLTDRAERIVSEPSGDLTDIELAIWREAVLALGFPHPAYPDISDPGVAFRPAHVMLAMLVEGPLPSQGLAFAFAARDESDEEIQRLRGLASRWTDEPLSVLAQEAGASESEVKNNAKVMPNLLEQTGLVRRGRGVAQITQAGLDALGAPGPNDAFETPVVPRSFTRRKVQHAAPSPWTPTPTNASDLAEKALLRSIRLERANQAHQAALLVADSYLTAKGFETHESIYDLHARHEGLRILIEVKSISAVNERRQLISAIGQLAYYASEAIEPLVDGETLVKVVLFNRKPAGTDIERVCASAGIELAWVDGEDIRFASFALPIA